MAKKEATSPADKKEGKPSQDGVRDAVESIVFAFLLALIFKTFEAEMFVIPTGSMAPTLYGRHKEAHCTECGNHIVVGASSELGRYSGRLAGRVDSAVCPNCGAVNEQIHDSVPFNGDRICVAKYPYEIGSPNRWDVFVFKYPIEPQTNYIKRLVGLPGETIRLRRGNVYLWNGETEQILRKAPDKQLAIQVPVHDNSKFSEKLLEAGWPERWAAVEKTGGAQGVAGWTETTSGWQFDESRRTFDLSEKATDWQWLRYRHYAPFVKDWADIEEGRTSIPLPRLIGDFCAYNAFAGTGMTHGEYSIAETDSGPLWTPDLTLQCRVNVKSHSPAGELLLELCEGVYWYRCRIDITTGAATLEEINEQMNSEDIRPLVTAETNLRGAGTYDLTFANVDDRLCLWINGRLVDFGTAAELNVPAATSNPFPVENDLAPIGIAARGVQMEVNELKVLRDIYYRGVTSEVHDATYNSVWRRLTATLRDPEGWAEIYRKEAAEYDVKEIVIPEGHYLALGDNSPQSLDGRLWVGQQTVPREYLVGKAFCIYWPHGVPFLNDGQGYALWPFYHQDESGRSTDYPTNTFPFYPQVQRMGRIR